MTEILPRAYDLDKDREMSSQENSKEVFRSAFHFLSGNVVSKISGLGRDICMALFFGASPLIASFMVAYRFCHFFRRFFGEGAIGSTFVPHFEKLNQVNQSRALQFYFDFLLLSTLFLTLFVGLMNVSVHALFAQLQPQWQQVASFTLKLLPALIFITIFAINQAFLQTQNIFFLPAMAPVFMNLFWICGVFLASNSGVDSLIRWILAGFCMQALVTFIPIFYLQGRAFFKRPFLEVRTVRKLIGSSFIVLVGIGALQINALIDGLFAKISDANGPAYLWYSIRIYQFPFSIFAISLASALLPKLSRSFDLTSYLKPASEKLIIFILPCTFAMFALGFSGMELLFGRGLFSIEDSVQTTRCFYSYAIGLFPACFVYIYSHAFYANKRFWLPSLLTLFSVCLNLLFNSLFIFVLQLSTISIALATSLASIAQLGLVLLFLNKECKIRSLFSFTKVGKIVISSVTAFFATMLVGSYIHDPTMQIFLGSMFEIKRNFLMQLFSFGLQAFCFLSFFLGVSFWLRIEEIGAFFRAVNPFFYQKDR